MAKWKEKLIRKVEKKWLCKYTGVTAPCYTPEMQLVEVDGQVDTELKKAELSRQTEIISLYFVLFQITPTSAVCMHKQQSYKMKTFLELGCKCKNLVDYLERFSKTSL